VIGGAWHSAVDYFAVQYGHFLNSRLHTAGQWCMYVKGGTAYLSVDSNEFYNCRLGFGAGQSSNFAVMRSPWLHYEAYDIKFVNNVLHDLPGVGLSVMGGYNILLAYNTLVRVGASSDPGYPLLEAVRGERGCHATDELLFPLSTCQGFISQGGWGPNYVTANAVQPQLTASYRPISGSTIYAAPTYAIPNFTWSDAPTPPVVLAGTLINTVRYDRAGEARPTSGPPGAYVNAGAPLTPALYLPLILR
jgi:hypothetical protein